MKKTETWDIDLFKFIDEVREKPFVWGEWDCCQFCGGAVEAMTGFNPAKNTLGRYESYRSSIRTVKKLGFDTLFEFLGDTFGPGFPIYSAGRGDIVYTVHEGGPTVGVCVGELSVFVGDSGLVERKTRTMGRVFKIG